MPSMFLESNANGAAFPLQSVLWVVVFPLLSPRRSWVVLLSLLLQVVLLSSSSSCCAVLSSSASLEWCCR